MEYRKVSGSVIIFMGLAAGFPNWLWLIGVLPEPSGALMGARWIYEIFAIMAGVMIGWMPA